MFTVELSAGAIFVMGFAIGLIVGVVALAIIAAIVTKKK